MRPRILVAVALSAAVLALSTGCQTPGEGAVYGGLLGAGTGALIGENSHHHAGEGALIGGAAGALGGAIVGNEVQKRREAQQRYYSAPPPPPPGPVAAPAPQRGHYETRLVKTASGETYEERVWVPDR